MTSNTSQQELGSLEGGWGGKADKDCVSRHTQSEAAHNDRDVSADTDTPAIQQSGHLNHKPFRNERAGKEAAECSGSEFFSFLFLEQTLKSNMLGAFQKNL